MCKHECSVKNTICDRKPMTSFDNFFDFILSNCKTVFRYLVYKKVWTPYEQENKFEDESYFEDEHCNFGYIVECINLPDGDILLGFLNSEMLEGDHPVSCIEYYKLSEIRLEFCEMDQEGYEEDIENYD